LFPLSFSFSIKSIFSIPDPTDIAVTGGELRHELRASGCEPAPKVLTSLRNDAPVHFDIRPWNLLIDRFEVHMLRRCKTRDTRVSKIRRKAIRVTGKISFFSQDKSRYKFPLAVTDNYSETEILFFSFGKRDEGSRKKKPERSASTWRKLQRVHVKVADLISN